MPLPRLCFVLVVLAAAVSIHGPSRAAEEVVLRGSVVDAKTGRPLAARLYIEALADPPGEQRWHFARSADDQGSAVEYRRQRSPSSVEMHTTLSPHPFVATLPPGKYRITVERGKEYVPYRETISLGQQPDSLVIRLRRWIDMSRLGWYSGETHVHRNLDELPNAMLADDLNVALPLTYWVTKADTPPSRGDKNSEPVRPQLMKVDATHVIYPMNTEYEIFTVGGKRHALGAVFALNHKNLLRSGAPPVRPIAQQVRREGGLLELDKHNWPWSMMLVPVMGVDLYELTNNHIWRTEFYFRKFGEAPAAYMNVEQDDEGMTERGWIDFTLQNYYALLDCGFRLRPTAGTASGVHPVPLGFGRVYVHTGERFSYDAWIEGLDQGRSFVTTGPLLAVKLNDRLPGRTFAQTANGKTTYRLVGWARSLQPLTKIEIVTAGEVVRSVQPTNRELTHGGFETIIDESLEVAASTWVAVRAFERRDGQRLRFAHSAPFHVDVPGRPLRPRTEEVQYLIERVESEVARNAKVLSADALAEFDEALRTYRKIAETARGG